MEEEINYSTVVFKNSHPPPTEKKEESTIYSEVKPKGPATSAPNGEAAVHSQHFYLLAVCLGTICVLLVGLITAIIYVSIVMNEQKVKLSNLSVEKQQLIMQRSILEKDTETLRRERDNYNWTLRVILEFNNFPVNEYCPQKKCQSCQTGWIRFQDKCYLFYNEEAPWKTWTSSRAYCQNTAADLVVIDSLQELKFLSNHTEYYYDTCHGFWTGLYETDENKWFWVDGRDDIPKYWERKDVCDSGSHALMIPGNNVTATWDRAKSEMENKFICEKEVLIK